MFPPINEKKWSPRIGAWIFFPPVSAGLFKKIHTKIFEGPPPSRVISYETPFISIIAHLCSGFPTRKSWKPSTPSTSPKFGLGGLYSTRFLMRAEGAEFVLGKRGEFQDAKKHGYLEDFSHICCPRKTRLKKKQQPGLFKTRSSFGFGETTTNHFSGLIFQDWKIIIQLIKPTICLKQMEKIRFQAFKKKVYFKFQLFLLFIFLQIKFRENSIAWNEDRVILTWKCLNEESQEALQKSSCLHPRSLT